MNDILNNKQFYFPSIKHLLCSSEQGTLKGPSTVKDVTNSAFPPSPTSGVYLKFLPGSDKLEYVLRGSEALVHTKHFGVDWHFH